jgi:WD40 repeat protein
VEHNWSPTLQTLEGHSDWVQSVAFSPDGSKLASASADRAVRLWNVGTGQVEQTLEGHSGWVQSVAFSPDGSKLASASRDRTVRLWNVGTGQVEQTLEGHSGWVLSVAFSPDGSKLASASRDRAMRLWNVGTGQVEQTLEGHSDLVSSVASLLNNTNSHPIYTVDNSNCWVTQDSSRILYLPWDYRPGKVATQGCTLAIGAATGRVMIITFRSDVKA